MAISTINFFLRLLLTATVLFYLSTGSALTTDWIKSVDEKASMQLIIVDPPNDNGTLFGGIMMFFSEDAVMPWRTSLGANNVFTIDQSNSTNIASSRFFWTRPTRLLQESEYGDIAGYQKEVYFPLEFQLKNTNRYTIINLIIHFTLCEKNCIRYENNVVLSFNPRYLEIDPDHRYHLTEEVNPTVGFPIKRTSFELEKIRWDKYSRFLYLKFYNSQPWVKPDIFLEPLDNVSFGIPHTRISENSTIFKIPVYNWEFENTDISGKNITAFIADSYQNTEVLITIPDFSFIPHKLTFHALTVILISALLGGFMFNFMPCIIPALNFKTLFFINIEKDNYKTVQLACIAKSIGILSFFWLSAALFIGLRFMGIVPKWGQQFENPFLLIFLILISAVVAIDLFSNESRPIKVNKFFTIDPKNHSYSKDLKYAILGFMSALIGTPCIAPFLNSNIHFALTINAGLMIITFTCLGLGMALPYLIICWKPQLITKNTIPKKLVRFIQLFMGIIMLLTLSWLIYILQKRFELKLYQIATIHTIFISAVLYFVIKNGKKRLNKLKLSLLCIAILTIYACFITLFHWENYANKGSNQWHPLNIAEIDEKVSQGKVVFVDISAVWCLTCKLNWFTSLTSNSVHRKFIKSEVFLMHDELSNETPEGMYLMSYHAQSGVPFNIVYGPAAPDGIKLPIILSSRDIIEAIEDAKGH